MKLLKFLPFLFISAFAVTACDDSDEDATSGRIELSITDAPIDDENITGVYITILGVEIKENNEDDNWSELTTFGEPVKINLLDYQNGDVYFLTEEEIEAGEYSEIRLILDMPQGQGPAKANPGTYLEYDDGSTQPLFVPSGATSGYKAKGNFEVPAGGVTSLTIDFDVRKSVVKAGNSGKYILKPVLRLVENDNVALINGSVTTLDEYASVRVYAYENDQFTENEIFEPESDEVDFPNAVTSATVAADGTFTLAFMEPGIYDIYAVAFDEFGEYVLIIDAWQDVELEAGVIKVVDLEETEPEEGS